MTISNSASPSDIEAQKSPPVKTESIPQKDGVGEDVPLIQPACTPGLYGYDETPEIIRSPYLLTGYRLYYSWGQCFRSMFQVHNETVNILTHFFGGIFFLIMMIYSATLTARVAVAQCIYCFAACTLLFASTAYHTFSVDLPKYTLFLRFDLSSICVLIALSYVPPVSFGFLCYPTLVTIYLVIIIVLAACASVVCILPCFLPCRVLRASLLLVVGWFALFPVGNAVYLYGWAGAWPLASRLLIMGGFYSVGCFFYLSRIPERFAPGKFDNWGHSHQLWHFFILAAAIYHYWAMISLYADQAAIGRC
ncbi:putative adiponectin receptor 1b [Paratrimastix pyriformis]|uniref:Adiponectin receptor 1b n=1 Tax=Paratrimastix pyriformis TaxID=342808 RepID=A0ABQ8UX79_9EUKA|nr:putative adiponectin receptor 1b [Paratrimastix pyriformis]